jgi:hypothetical protein
MHWQVCVCSRVCWWDSQMLFAPLQVVVASHMSHVSSVSNLSCRQICSEIKTLGGTCLWARRWVYCWSELLRFWIRRCRKKGLSSWVAEFGWVLELWTIQDVKCVFWANTVQLRRLRSDQMCSAACVWQQRMWLHRIRRVRTSCLLGADSADGADGADGADSNFHYIIIYIYT